MPLKQDIPLKPDYERAAKKSVSMPRILLDDARLRQKELRLTKFSDYLQYLVRLDVVRARGEREGRFQKEIAA